MALRLSAGCAPVSTKTFLLTMLLVLGSLGSVTATPQDEAAAILNATNVPGGLVVHVNCGTGDLTAALRQHDRYLVLGLDRDATDVAAARQHVDGLGLYGPVTVDQWVGARLPLTDNLVNLLIVDEQNDLAADEAMRVLAPQGVAYIKRDGQWTQHVKARPEEIDQWTHFLHGPDNNAVSADRQVGPPRRMQWLAEPMWTRNHHTLSSISSVVSAGGRLFYILDESPAANISVPSRWSLIARDAFNGITLWKRSLSDWANHRRKFRSGPVQLPRTLVAVGDVVYMPLGVDAPVAALDAATGDTIRTYQDTRGTEELIVSDGTLWAVVADAPEHAPERKGGSGFNHKTIRAIATDSGQVLWQWRDDADTALMPLTLAVSGSRVFCQTGDGVMCLSSGTGEPLWRFAGTRPAAAPGDTTAAPKNKKAAQGGKRTKRASNKKRGSTGSRSSGWSTNTLVVSQDVVLWANGNTFAALSAKDGRKLWQCSCSPTFKSPVDVLAVDGTVWLGPSFREGRDLHSGDVVETNSLADDVWTAGHHHRCYRNKATERFLLTSKRGVEFFDLDGDNHSRNNWVRGLCQYGVMPCNGLLYAPPHSCGCYMTSKLYGFWALAPGTAAGTAAQLPEQRRLRQGPAYGEIPTPRAGSDPADWPTYRHDPQRSGATISALATPLKKAWIANIGGRLTAPVAASGLVVVADVDAQQVVALDGSDGSRKWSYTAGGRVDSPPTIHQGRVLFGAADGYVYCLRATDGQLAWRFLAAPEDRRTVARDRVESLWPVHGSVLVQHGVVYAAAGRCSWLDGGIWLYALDPDTGKIVAQHRFDSEAPTYQESVARKGTVKIEKSSIGQNKVDWKTLTDPDQSDGFANSGALTDVLVGDGENVFMKQVQFDRQLRVQDDAAPHLYSTSRLLDDVQNHRSHWMIGKGDFSRIPVAYSWIANARGGRQGVAVTVPYGLMLAFDADNVWGVWRDSAGYQLWESDNRVTNRDIDNQSRVAGTPRKSPFSWKMRVSLRPRAIVRGDDVVLVGGAADDSAEGILGGAAQPEKGKLIAVSRKNGATLFEQVLYAPVVWDGLAVARGRLYVSTTDGKILCMSGP